MKRIKPSPGQQSVWDYPRPPAVEACSNRIRVVVGGVVIADSSQTQRVLETSHPPVYYIPPADVLLDHLHLAAGSSFCEFKGRANYYDVRVGRRVIEQACWSYLQPRGRYETIASHVAFYPSKVDQCYVDDELVQAQAGDFYGGWITSQIVGPFKGGPGTWGW